MDKKENENNSIRKRISDLLRNQKEDDRLKKSRVIQEKLFALPEFQRAKVILFYASFKGDVETFKMMEQAQQSGKQIALPRITQDKNNMIPSMVDNLNTDLNTGPYGIQQPKQESARDVALKDLDLVIVPGVAFDKDNNRLGRGAGYYDRFLRNCSAGTPTVGLAFDFQIVDRLPHQQEHDMPVALVITN